MRLSRRGVTVGPRYTTILSTDGRMVLIILDHACIPTGPLILLGSNDLKDSFHLSAREIADGAGVLVDEIKSFTKEKQDFVPKIILVSPPEIGENISASPFYGDFFEDAIERSRQFPKEYKRVAEEKGCIFFDAAKHIRPSEFDSLHLTPEGHRVLAEKLCEVMG